MSLLSTIESLLAPEEAAIIAYYKSLLAKSTALPAEGLAVVTAAVHASEAKGGTGLSKLEAALTYIANEFETKAIPFVETVVRGLIEAAVAALPKVVSAVEGAAVSAAITAVAAL